MSNVLTPQHKQFLNAFPFNSTGFYLTGGSALSAYYLKHRRSDDLDLFTPDKADFERITALQAELQNELGGRWKTETTAPNFQRVFWSSENSTEQIKIDFVRETVNQVIKDKPIRKDVRVDTPEDICANKITTLISRQEIKDAIDLFFLAEANYRPQQFFEHAREKDAGLTKEIFSQITGSIELNEWPSFMIKKPSPDKFNDFFQSLSHKFARDSFPGK